MMPARSRVRSPTAGRAHAVARTRVHPGRRAGRVRRTARMDDPLAAVRAPTAGWARGGARTRRLRQGRALVADHQPAAVVERVRDAGQGPLAEAGRRDLVERSRRGRGRTARAARGATAPSTTSAPGGRRSARPGRRRCRHGRRRRRRWAASTPRRRRARPPRLAVEVAERLHVEALGGVEGGVHGADGTDRERPGTRADTRAVDQSNRRREYRRPRWTSTSRSYGRRDITGQVFDQLADLDRQRRPPPGDRLPPTRELATQLQRVAHDGLGRLRPADGRGLPRRRASAPGRTSATTSGRRRRTSARRRARCARATCGRARRRARSAGRCSRRSTSAAACPTSRGSRYESWRRLVAREIRPGDLRRATYGEPAGQRRPARRAGPPPRRLAGRAGDAPTTS